MTGPRTTNRDIDDPMTMTALLRYAFLAALPAALLAAPLPGAAQSYQEWTVQCDNVGHCEAAGYASERDTEYLLAFRIARDAGPGTPVAASIVLFHDGPKPPVLAMTVDRRQPVAIRANKPMPRDVAQKVLATMIDGREGRISDGKQQWTLPLAGMKAALLRMDAVQGRAGTPGALVRRGRRPEAAVPPAPAMPVLRAVARAEIVQDRAIKAALLAQMRPVDESDIDYHSLHRLPDGRLFLLLEAARGVNTTFHEAWLANGQPPYEPRQVSLPTNGLWNEALMNASFDGHVLESYSGRILNECRDAAEWLWTGDRFELLSLYQADDCRGMLGMIEHRKWVARREP